MKMFKRILVFILAVICLSLSLGSCGNDSNVGTQKDSSKMYTDAKTKTESLTSYEIVKTVERVFTGESGSFGDTTVTALKSRAEEDGSTRYSMNTSVTLKTENGEDATKESSLYCIDNMMYEKSVSGEKISYVAKDADITERFHKMIPTFPAEALSKSSVYEGEVTQVISKTEASTLYSLLYNYLGGLTEYYSPVEGENVFEFTYSNVSISFDIDNDGYFKYIKMNFDAHFDHKKGRSEIKTVVTFEFSDPSEQIEVNVPEDANEYIWYVSNEDPEVGSLEADVESLFDELGNPVADYELIYEELCERYGKEAVDEAIAEY